MTDYVTRNGKKVHIDINAINGPGVRITYEKLIISQPHIRFRGLWKKGLDFYILCKEPVNTLKAADNTQLTDWFNDNKIAGCPVELINELPTDAEEVPVRTPDEAVNLVDDLGTLRDEYVTLSLSLPEEFPDFSFEIDVETRTAIVFTSRILTIQEKGQLEAA